MYVIAAAPDATASAATPPSNAAIHAALWDYAEKNGIKIEGLERPVNDISEKEEEEEY